MSGATRTIVLMRHPETVANTEHRFIGRTDSPLTARGRDQVRWLTGRLAVAAPLMLYTSPLHRARGAAEAIAPPGCSIVVVPQLAEIDFGRAEGLTWEEVTAAGISLTYDGDAPIAPGGESAASLDARVTAFVRQLAEAPSVVAVMTHGGVARRLLAVLLGLSPEDGWRFAVPNACLATVSWTGERGVLEALEHPPVRA